MRISTRLVLNAVVFVVPIAVLFFLWFDGINYDIHFARKEMYGNAWQRPLEELLRRVPEHRLLTARVRAGETEASGRILDVTARIDAAFGGLKKVDAELADELAFTPEGLAARDRARLAYDEFLGRWKALKNARAMSAAEADAAYDAMEADIRSAISHAGDTSNLILDPDLDSYYMMDLTLLKLPEAQHRLARIMRFADEAWARGDMTEAERIRAAVFAAELEQDMAGVRSSADTSFQTDPQFYGDSATLEKTVTPALTAWESSAGALLPLVRSLSETGLENVEKSAFRAAAQKARADSFALWTACVDELDALLAARIDDFSGSRLLGVLLALLAVGVAAGLVWIISASITEPLRGSAAVMSNVAAGDLGQRLPVDGEDEVADMARSFNLLVEKLQKIVASLRETTRALSDTAGLLRSASASMGEDVADTVDRANVVSSAAEEVSRNSQTVATGTEEMSASIREIAQHAGEAARVAGEAVDMADSTNESISKLSDSSAAIGQVINVITDIAEQTNLLALNATIEAARVGEAGKGFAVVAGEVKDLASETARATEDIQARIETIQKDASGAVEAIGEIQTIIHSINEFQSTIAAAVEEQTATTNEMSRNVSEAARGSAEIAESITGVADSARSATDHTERTREAAEQLHRLAGELDSLVKTFHR